MGAMCFFFPRLFNKKVLWNNLLLFDGQNGGKRLRILNWVHCCLIFLLQKHSDVPVIMRVLRPNIIWVATFFLVSNPGVRWKIWISIPITFKWGRNWKIWLFARMFYYRQFVCRYFLATAIALQPKIMFVPPCRIECYRIQFSMN